METQTLYSRDSKGNILEWSIRVEKKLIPIVSSNHPIKSYDRIIIEEGLLEGKKTMTTVEVKKGKNLGKMNETTPYEQAVSQAKSRIEKKRKQGYKSLDDLRIYHNSTAWVYRDDKDREVFNGRGLEQLIDYRLPKLRTDANNLSKPMKAQPYFKDSGEVRISFPCIAQPKLNGFRVMCRYEEVEIGEGLFLEKVLRPTFRSKEGLRYDILQHIEQEFTPDLFKWKINNKEIDLIFDGEMYIHGEILSEISSAVRKRNSKTPNLKFYIFDLAVPDLRQDERIRILDDLKRLLESRNINSIKIVYSTEVINNEEAQRLTDAYIQAGYEGGIFRSKSAKYEFGKRPQTMVKLKRFQDKEFPIVDIVGGDNSPDLGVFVCRAENGLTFKCTPEGSHEVKKEYLRNKQSYIGKLATVRFFERTKDNIPFHAVASDIRDYE